MTAREAFVEDCFEKYYDFLLKLCRRRVGNNLLYADLVDSCIQDTFLLVYQSYPDLLQHPNPRAWLARTCLNRLLPYAQLQRNRIAHEAFSLDAKDFVLSTFLVDSESLNLLPLLDEIHSLLTEREWLIFKDYFLEGISLADIAHRRQIHTGTVKAVLHTIRKKLEKRRESFWTICKKSCVVSR